ncbi:MAG: hypothetical protein U0231_08180 [Nitrospiraceae bacterium]
MKYPIQTIEDLRWFLAHTQGFRGGYVTDLHLSKRRLFDEVSGREVLVGTVVTLVIRYHTSGVLRVAKLTFSGVSDISVLEQEGADCSVLGVIQAEFSEGHLRFWFDPQGKLYVVCEEAFLEEVSSPRSELGMEASMAQWVFQADEADAPTVEWLLDALDEAGLPSVWKPVGQERKRPAVVRWEGDLTAPAADEGRAASVSIQAYGPLDGAGFGIRLRTNEDAGRQSGQLLAVVADIVTRHFSGTCLVGQTLLS